MRLLRLKLNEKFRSLQKDFEVHFLREWDYVNAEDFNPYCLVGRNGSGKSNVLEALAAIFYHIECMYLDYRPDDFAFEEEENPNGFRGDVCFPNAFELEYFFPKEKIWETSDGGAWLTNDKKKWATSTTGNAHIFFKKEIGKAPVIEWKNRSEFEQDINTLVLNRTEVKDFLPKYILGYSSGENEILSLPFFKMRFIHFDEYADRLTKGFDYGQAPEGRMVFLDTQFSQAILLCNFLFQSPDILKPFKKEIRIECVNEFRIIINQHHYLDMHIEYLQGLSEKERSKQENIQVALTNKVIPLISKLRRCSTAYFYDEEKKSLYLDYWVNDATRKAFRFHFGDALNLFQAFQILLTLNLYKVNSEIKKKVYSSESLFVKQVVPVPPASDQILRFANFWIKKEGIEELILSKALSDGEHQFIHSLGLCLLFKDQPNLFLLDEPETHFNPDWRAQFISSLRNCLEKDEAKNVMREMLITSHSPFIVSDSKKEYVLLFEKKYNEIKHADEVSCTRPDFNTFGASVNQITIKIFDKPETIGDYAHNSLKELERRFEAGEDGEALIKEANRELGDSVEKIQFINRVLDAMEK